MKQSNWKEKKWGDIGYWGFVALTSPLSALDTLGDRIGSFAWSDAKPSRLAFLAYPARVAAQSLSAGGRTAGNDGWLLAACFGVALVPACYAAQGAALGLGFSVAGLASGNILGSALILAAAAGTGLMALTTCAAAAIGCAAVGLGVMNLVCNTHKVWRAFRDGCRATRRPDPPAPPEPPPAADCPPVQPVPPLLRELDAAAATLAKATEEERAAYFKGLRRKFPADFADATRTGLPELRRDVKVGRPVKFRRSPKEHRPWT